MGGLIIQNALRDVTVEGGQHGSTAGSQERWRMTGSESR